MLMYQQLCTLCRAWLTERSPENEQKGVCVCVEGRGARLYMCEYKGIQCEVCMRVCVLVSALVDAL